ncbi:TPA: aspartate-semialdehyde dehydrogenase [Candidatus Bathyarchaeota archaeon]|nr:aspartate-semialdehyde dehydrogenase [Candidatus Bathyarchaeota archaeon]
MIEVGILGATGLVGQRFVEILVNHPWFKIASVAASERSANKKYASLAKWRLNSPVPESVAELMVVTPEPKKVGDVSLVFSALPSSVAGPIEERFAKDGYIVVSNAASHRMEADVPILNPEANSNHIQLIEEQRRRRGWDGAILTNPNCTTAILTLSLKPLMDRFGITRVIVSTMQALSGAGYPGVASLDIVDNVIPFIAREEEKVETETKKILGNIGTPAEFKVSASCHRVATLDGHLEAVFVELKERVEVEDVIEAMKKFKGEPQELNLPTAPKFPLIVRLEQDRPQPRYDRMEERGMSVVVGRVRKDPALNGVKYLALGHNTIRGAAGCAVLIAELLKVKGYLS